MSDHNSGPRAVAEPAIDIGDLYVYPSPSRPGRLVLIMTVFPNAQPGALFSDAESITRRQRGGRSPSRRLSASSPLDCRRSPWRRLEHPRV
jgi:hypothetical protein